MNVTDEQIKESKFFRGEVEFTREAFLSDDATFARCLEMEIKGLKLDLLALRKRALSLES